MANKMSKSAQVMFKFYISSWLNLVHMNFPLGLACLLLTVLMNEHMHCFLDLNSSVI